MLKKRHRISRQQFYLDNLQNMPFYTVQIYINFLALPNHIQNHLLCYLVHSHLLKNNKKPTKHYFSGQVWCQASGNTRLKHNQITWMLRTDLPIKPNGLCVDYNFGQTGNDSVPETQYFSYLLLIFFSHQAFKKKSLCSK